VSTTPTTLTMTVSPALDVLPIAGSHVLAMNQAWQVNVVDNRIDESCDTLPPAPPFPRSALAPGIHYPSAGLLNLYSAGADLAVDSNRSTDAAGIAIFAQYSDQSWTDAGGMNQYTQQSPQYFVDVRANTLTGQFGGASNASNTYGSGVYAYTITTVETTAGGPGQPNDPALPGFGLTVASNALTDALIHANPWGVSQRVGIWLWTQSDSIESPAPGYVDTLVFGNQVGLTTPDGSPACTSGVQPTTYAGPYESAISIGTAYGYNTGGANYPQGTVLCGDTETSLGCLYTDWPATAGASSVAQCH
jgi:hypothetical protein